MQKLLYNAIHTKIGGENLLVYFDGGDLPSERVTCLHYHNRCEIVICLRGNGLWVMGDKTYALSPGDIVINYAGIPHYSRSIPTVDSQKCQCRFFYFDQRRLFDAAGIQADIYLANCSLRCPVVVNHRTHRELWFFLDRMISAVQTCADREQGYLMAAHWYALFLLELKNRTFTQESFIEVQNMKILPAFQKIIVDFSDEITLKMLADSCFMSTYYFINAFSKEFGCPPIRYLNQFRVKIAAQLLAESNISITAICDFVGFSAPSELYRHFVSAYGISPTKYRNYRNGTA